jgi:hypothetical protein
VSCTEAESIDDAGSAAGATAADAAAGAEAASRARSSSPSTAGRTARPSVPRFLRLVAKPNQPIVVCLLIPGFDVVGFDLPLSIGNPARLV